MSLATPYSENEDDPEVFESSGDEWNADVEKKRTKRRTSKRLSKKTRVQIPTDSTDSSNDDDESTKRSKNGMNKKQKISNSRGGGKINSRNIPKTPIIIPAEDFTMGSFVILKKDAQVGDPNKPPCIWRVDGKALLQKYEPFDDEGIIKHKGTSIYTGWSPLDKDQYAPIEVKWIKNGSQGTIVQLSWEKLKEINMDSE